LYKRCILNFEMATRKKVKHGVKRGDYTAASHDLGVDISHLRRCVIGERRSKVLVQKFRVWLRAHRSPSR
jgi:hypothetical protein